MRRVLNPRMRLAFARGEASSAGGKAEDRGHPHLGRLRTALAATVASWPSRRPSKAVPVQLQLEWIAGLPRTWHLGLDRGPSGGRGGLPPSAAGPRSRGSSLAIVASILARGSTRCQDRKSPSPRGRHVERRRTVAATNGVRLRPSPCSPLIVPPTRTCGKDPWPPGASAARPPIVKVQKRLDVELPMTPVAEQRRRDLPAFQHVVVAEARKAGENFRRNGDVLNHGHRPAWPLHGDTRAAGSLWASRQNGEFPPGRKHLPAHEGRPGCCWHISSTSRWTRSRTFGRVVGLGDSTRSTASVSAGDQQVEADFALPGDAEVAAIHQVAGRRLVGRISADGPRLPSPGSRTAAAQRRTEMLGQRQRDHVASVHGNQGQRLAPSTKSPAGSRNSPR